MWLSRRFSSGPRTGARTDPGGPASLASLSLPVRGPALFVPHRQLEPGREGALRGRMDAADRHSGHDARPHRLIRRNGHDGGLGTPHGPCRCQPSPGRSVALTGAALGRTDRPGDGWDVPRPDRTMRCTGRDSLTAGGRTPTLERGLTTDGQTHGRQQRPGCTVSRGSGDPHVERQRLCVRDRSDAEGSPRSGPERSGVAQSPTAEGRDAQGTMPAGLTLPCTPTLATASPPGPNVTPALMFAARVVSGETAHASRDRGPGSGGRRVTAGHGADGVPLPVGGGQARRTPGPNEGSTPGKPGRLARPHPPRRSVPGLRTERTSCG
jgi:hypothetical protein